VLATTATHARGATPAATMRYVLTTTATGTLASIAAATMCHVLATVYCTITLAKTNATAAGINNPLATAAAKIQPLFKIVGPICLWISGHQATSGKPCVHGCELRGK
jgi:hypothetical protein